jgi:hypothetical protein
MDPAGEAGLVLSGLQRRVEAEVVAEYARYNASLEVTVIGRTLLVVAVFVGAYAAFVIVARECLPRLQAWHYTHCTGASTAACSLSAAMLSYWWLALLPCTLATALLAARLRGRKRSA